MNMVLGQLPSGKIEMTLQELAPHLPPGYLQPAEALAGYLSLPITLPLMDVVMRIPPDLLALRPDQKAVDASVTSMADPFTEEILREQANAVKPAAPPAMSSSQPNIIDESQVPSTEEFVPRDMTPPPGATATKSFVPPPRPPTGVLPVPKLPASGALPVVPPRPMAAPSAATGMPPMPSAVRSNSPVPPPAPNSSSRRISPSGRLPQPVRATSPLPRRAQTAATAPVSTPAVAPSSMAPPFPGASSRPTIPMSRVAPTVPMPQQVQPPLNQSARLAGTRPATPPMPTSPPAIPPPVSAPSAPPSAPMERQVEPGAAGSLFPAPGQPDAAADELQRLAALAMSQLGDEDKKPVGAAAETTVFPNLNESGTTPAAPATSLAAEAPSIPPAPPSSPTAAKESAVDVKAAMAETRSLSRSISSPAITPSAVSSATPEKEKEPAAAEAPSTAFNLNSCTVEELLQIPGCTQSLAESIVRHRSRVGSFKKIEDLLEVPGMNSSAYSSLTGEAPPKSSIPQDLTELLGFPEDQKITLKDVTERIGCWPDVTGCVLGQGNGLSLVGSVPKNFDKAAIVAFAPRMFDGLNKSFGEIAGKEANELIIPTSGTSFHIFRNGDLYLIILSRLPQMPDRHVKIARLVLAGLSLQPV
jgi:competence ComEA-like helix-hairpin-helix protein